MRTAAVSASLLVLAALPASCTRRGDGPSAAGETPSVPAAADATTAPPLPDAGTPADAGAPAPAADAGAVPPAVEAPGVTTMDQLLALAEAFAQPTFGVPEAQALLGPLAQPRPVRSEGYLDYELQPAAGLEWVVLETHRGVLIGIQLDFGPSTLAVRTDELASRWGTPRGGPPPVDSRLPPTLIYDLEGEAYTRYFSLQPAEPPDGEAAVLEDAILRRTPAEESVPERWSSEDDLPALFRLVFRAGPLEPVTLYGSCGVFAGHDGGEIRLGAAESRNVAEGRIVAERGADGLDEVRAVRLWLAEPIAVDPARLAEKAGARLEAGAEGPQLVFERGTVALRLDEAGALTELSCRRTLDAAP